MKQCQIHFRERHELETREIGEGDGYGRYPGLIAIVTNHEESLDTGRENWGGAYVGREGGEAVAGGENDDVDEAETAPDEPISADEGAGE